MTHTFAQIIDPTFEERLNAAGKDDEDCGEDLTYEEISTLRSMYMSSRRIENQISGRVESLVKSDAWKPAFKDAVESRPSIAVSYGGDVGTGCEACGRKHPAPWRCTLSGPLTRSGALYIDANGSPTPKGGRGERDREWAENFRVGSYCCARAHLFHALLNWKRLLLIHLERCVNPLMLVEMDQQTRVRKILTEARVRSLLDKHTKLCRLADTYRSDGQRHWRSNPRGDDNADELYSWCYSLGVHSHGH